MSCLSTTLILSMFLALDAYVFTLTGSPVSEMIPCPDQHCDFSSLSAYLPNDTITVLDQLWSQRLADKNTSVLYYCGNRMTSRIETEPCDTIREQFTLAILTLLPLLAVMIACIDARRVKKHRQHQLHYLPKYEELIHS